jgi:hypothetical protein
MSKFENYGNGINGRVDGPLFDARAILIPGALALGSIVETLQTDLQGTAKESIHLSDPVHKIIGELAFMPLDAKALGVSFAAAAATQMSYAARSVKEIYVENGLIGIGVSPESAVENPALSRRRKLGALAVTGLTAAIAYKVGEQFSQTEDLIASAGLIGLSALYFANTRKKFTRKQQ